MAFNLSEIVVEANFSNSSRSLSLPLITVIFLRAHHILVTLACLIGNSLVLYGSVKYGALQNIDSASVIFLQHLAVADFLVGLLRMIPTLIVDYTNEWILGSIVCWINGQWSWIPQKMEFTLIAITSVHRTFILYYPLSTKGIKRKVHATRICIAAWVSVSFIIMIDVICGMKVGYSAEANGCAVLGVDYGEDLNPDSPPPWLPTLILYMFMPLLVIVTANILILVRVSKVRKGSPGFKAIMTVSLVSWTFTTCLVPLSTQSTLRIFRVDISSLQPTFSIISWECLLINIWINPVIYMVTNRSFKVFMMKWGKRWILQWSTVSKISRCNDSKAGGFSGSSSHVKSEAGKVKCNNVKETPFPSIVDDAEKIDLPLPRQAKAN